ncbi:MAG TPA: acyltransferase [Rhodopila sp.]|nr:acyltransferase [Rhodopila sp.]
MSRHKNNFDALRLFFASCVILSHSFALLGLHEPTIFGRSLGNVSVHGFFAISGYLISASYIQQPDFKAFSIKRVLRIAPGLIAAIVVAHWAADLCEQFAHNPVPYIADGPVWTLTWEVVCYALVFIVGSCGALTAAAMPTLFVVAWLIYLINIDDPSSSYTVVAPLFLTFAAGVFAQVTRVNLRKCAIPALCLLLFSAVPAISEPIVTFVRSNIPFLWGPPVSDGDIRAVSYLLSFPFVVLFVSLDVRPLLTIRDDLSYGVYLYGWIVAQTLVYLASRHGKQFSPMPFFVATMTVTLLVAWLSWRLIEQPALQLKFIFLRRKATQVT